MSLCRDDYTTSTREGEEFLMTGLVNSSFWFAASPGLVIGIALLGRCCLPLRGLRTSPISWLASIGEEQAFRLLENRYPPGQYIISAHMLLIDVIGRDRLWRLSSTDQEFAWKAHVDFVVVTREFLTVLTVVEVDGPQHIAGSQQQRDKRKDQLLQRFGIAIERWSAGASQPSRGQTRGDS